MCRSLTPGTRAVCPWRTWDEAIAAKHVPDCEVFSLAFEASPAITAPGYAPVGGPSKAGEETNLRVCELTEVAQVRIQPTPDEEK